jgi:hypothetical protein
VEKEGSLAISQLSSRTLFDTETQVEVSTTDVRRRYYSTLKPHLPATNTICTILVG